MLRALWSVPSAIAAWFVLGFTPSYLSAGNPGALVPSATSSVDVLIIGGFTGGVAVGLLVGRVRASLGLGLLLASAAWWFSDHSFIEARGLWIVLSVASLAGSLAGALGSRRSVPAAFALTLPLASYIVLPGEPLAQWRWLWELNGLLIAIGLAVLFHVAIWRTGWRAAYYWLPITAAYVASFAFIEACARVAGDLGKGLSADLVADGASDAFFLAFGPFLLAYWPWLAAAFFLAIPMTAMKVRALPPPSALPADSALDGRGNDAFIPGDLDWIDREEPVRRLLPRRP
ncbi:hypothetical protein [Kribbella deserti]|uniref:Uncharacterized protein n=1 Tax=Kribbella deserti TaxID=1926257 RepID=A0ABV6QLD6_9ACTN